MYLKILSCVFLFISLLLWQDAASATPQNKALDSTIVIADLNKQALALDTIADNFYNHGDVNKALDYHYKSLKIQEGIQNKELYFVELHWQHLAIAEVK